MQYKTKELNIIKHPNRILEISFNEEIGGVLSLEEVDNNLQMLAKVMQGKDVATLIHVSNSYVKKDILKQYSDLEHIVVTALIVNSYASKLIGNLFITIISRFNSRQVPTKLFMDKEEAVMWLEKTLNNIS